MGAVVPLGAVAAALITAVLVGTCMFAGYLLHALADPALSTADRILRVLVLFTLPCPGPVGSWYAHVWRRAPAPVPGATALAPSPRAIRRVGGRGVIAGRGDG